MRRAQTPVVRRYCQTIARRADCRVRRHHSTAVSRWSVTTNAVTPVVPASIARTLIRAPTRPPGSAYDALVGIAAVA